MKPGLLYFGNYIIQLFFSIWLILLFIVFLCPVQTGIFSVMNAKNRLLCIRRHLGPEFRPWITVKNQFAVLFIHNASFSGSCNKKRKICAKFGLLCGKTSKSAVNKCHLNQDLFEPFSRSLKFQCFKKNKIPTSTANFDFCSKIRILVARSRGAAHLTFYCLLSKGKNKKFVYFT